MFGGAFKTRGKHQRATASSPSARPPTPHAPCMGLRGGGRVGAGRVRGAQLWRHAAVSPCRMRRSLPTPPPAGSLVTSHSAGRDSIVHATFMPVGAQAPSPQQERRVSTHGSIYTRPGSTRSPLTLPSRAVSSPVRSRSRWSRRTPASRRRLRCSTTTTCSGTLEVLGEE